MPTTITWDSFDKAFWVSSTNMRNLMKAAIGTSSDLNNMSTDLSEVMRAIRDLGPVLRSIDERLTALENGGGGGGGGGGGSIDPSDPLYIQLQQQIEACERAIEAHGHSISDIRVDIIKLDARVTALESKV